jgi:hypothetical protein
VPLFLKGRYHYYAPSIPGIRFPIFARIIEPSRAL